MNDYGGKKARWEGTCRNGSWHGLGIFIYEADGIRKHMLMEEYHPTELSDF